VNWAEMSDGEEGEPDKEENEDKAQEGEQEGEKVVVK